MFYNSRKVKKIFPYQTPSQDILDGTYTLTRNFFEIGYHQTTTNIFLSALENKYILLPQCAQKVTFNINQILKEELPFTRIYGREYAVWWGRLPLKSSQIYTNNLTPEKENIIKIIIEKIKSAYQKKNYRKLKKIFEINVGIGGWWLKYYTEILPNRLEKNDVDALNELDEMFANSLEIIDYSLKKFSELTNEDKVLLKNGFNIILEAKMPTHSIYFDPDIPKVLAGNLNYRPNQYCTDNPPRSPYEIISITTGNKVEELQVIYFPDEVKGTDIEKIVKARAYSLGFRGQFKYYSELNVLQYNSCLDRYNSFTWADLKEMIKTGVLEKTF